MVKTCFVQLSVVRLLQVPKRQDGKVKTSQNSRLENSSPQTEDFTVTTSTSCLVCESEQQVSPAEPTALWLIAVFTPCSTLTVPKMSPNVTHPLSLCAGGFSPHADDSWTVAARTWVWKCPICLLYKWSGAELLWRVSHLSLVGQTCCFVNFKSKCKCCWMWTCVLCTLGNRRELMFLGPWEDHHMCFKLVCRMKPSSSILNVCLMQHNSSDPHKESIKMANNHISSLTSSNIYSYWKLCRH